VTDIGQNRAYGRTFKWKNLHTIPDWW
jgi:hypothetical protein